MFAIAWIGEDTRELISERVSVDVDVVVSEGCLVEIRRSVFAKPALEEIEWLIICR